MSHHSSSEKEVDYARVNELVLNMLKPPGMGWYLLLATCIALVILGGYAWSTQILDGLVQSGKNTPVGWRVYITNFVFWVGIAHSGTLISAVLFLFRARFRMPIYRLAEAMTVFAVLTAGLFPIIHVGRPWFAYWLMPIPNERALWPNFRSPLLWDVFAVSTYLTVSTTFFIVGLIPDIAAARDWAKSKFRKILYSITSLGWTGNHKQWKHYMAAYMLFAALATPLVVSVHSVVSWDFAIGNVPGWHATIFPPYFVAGAIFSGVAMVLTLLIPIRKTFGLQELVTDFHFDGMAKLILLTANIVGYAYATEFYMAWFSNNQFERAQFWFRPFGELNVAFWIMAICNVVLPQILWWSKARTNVALLFVLSIFINIGMWFERFNIIVQSLSHEFIPAVWNHGYNFTWVEISITAAAFGWFGMYMTIFVRFFPAFSIAEIKELIPPPRRVAAAHH